MARRRELHIIDNDKDEVHVTINGNVVRSWSYADDTERRIKMRLALEYIAGWRDAEEDRQ